MRIIFLIVCLMIPWTTQAATYGQRIVAAVLMAEAWGEGEIGMMAVAEVIRNRAQERHRSPLGVVTTPKQFSCLNNTSPEALYGRFATNPDYEKALRIARLIYNQPERLPGHAQGANHYTRSDEQPSWAVGKQPVVVIGAHAFYRLDPMKRLRTD